MSIKIIGREFVKQGKHGYWKLKMKNTKTGKTWTDWADAKGGPNRNSLKSKNTG
tara:strand:- start:42 stop:203 length:162 start_codon:yes stop_codon:yes gene_type:complete